MSWTPQQIQKIENEIHEAEDRKILTEVKRAVLEDVFSDCDPTPRYLSTVDELKREHAICQTKIETLRFCLTLMENGEIKQIEPEPHEPNNIVKFDTLNNMIQHIVVSSDDGITAKDIKTKLKTEYSRETKIDTVYAMLSGLKKKKFIVHDKDNKVYKAA